MKKMALLLSLALLAACGGGGTSGSNANTPVYQAGGPTGVLAVNIKETNKQAPTVSTTTKTMRRIVVTNPLIKNSAGKIVQFAFADYDKAVGPGGGISIANIPVANGYTVEMIDFEVPTKTFSSYSSISATFRRYSGATPLYDFTTDVIPASSTLIKPYKVVKYASATFDMPAAGISSVTLTPADPPISLALATTFHGGIPSNANLSFNNLSTLYKIKVNQPAISPISTTNWNLKGGYINSLATILAAPATGISGVTSANLVGPAAYDSNNAFYTHYYSVGEFYLKDTLVLGAEIPSNFVITSPVLDSTLFTKTANFGNYTGLH